MLTYHLRKNEFSTHAPFDACCPPSPSRRIDGLLAAGSRPRIRGRIVLVLVLPVVCVLLIRLGRLPYTALPSTLLLLLLLV
jgi:hypothetical protein